MMAAFAAKPDFVTVYDPALLMQIQKENNQSRNRSEYYLDFVCFYFLSNDELLLNFIACQ
jgi:hypothetical protein